MSDTETAKFEEVIAAFEEANPGIKVEATRYAPIQHDLILHGYRNLLMRGH
jgi:ABC-type glycerol-3-phosphate transport system substrate-binding protein